MMLPKNSSVSLLHRLAQVVVEIGECLEVRLDVFQVAQIEPLVGEIRDQRLGAFVGQHAPHLLFQHRRILELALAGQGQQLIVGNGAPEKERQARRQFQIADAIRLVRRGVGRIGLKAENEFGAGQDALDRGFDTQIEIAAVVAAELIEADQRLHDRCR